MTSPLLFLALLVTVAGSPGCATSGQLASLRTQVDQLRQELQQTRQQTQQAQAMVRELDLQTEVHTYLQRDRMLAQGGRLPALEQRVAGWTRSYSFRLPSDLGGGTAQTLYFPPGVHLRIDFFAGQLPTSEPNRLEVSTRTESFRPLSQPEATPTVYQITEQQALVIQTREPRAGTDSSIAEVLFRYLPARGPSPVRHAYVRVTLLEAAPQTEADAEPPTALPRVRPAGSSAPEPVPPAAAPKPARSSTPPATVEDDPPFSLEPDLPLEELVR